MAASKISFAPLDESQVSGDGGEMYLFQWLASAEKSLKDSSASELKSIQAEVEAALIKTISAPSPFPLPGRPFRNLVARCLLHIYTRGESRSLYDTVQTFLKIAAEPKVLDKDVHKTAALYCAGELMGVFGAQIMSLVSETVNVSLKLLKSSTAIILRFHALEALRKTVSAAKRAVSDAATKDIIKQMRYCLADKALAIQRGACDVLISMYPASETQITVAEVETILILAVKALEGADQLTRRSLSRLVGHVLSLTQQAFAPPPPEPPKKAKKKDGKTDEASDEDDGVAISKVAPEDMKTVFTPVEMLQQLAVHFNKPVASRRTRIGVFDFYVALLTALGAPFVERHYALITQHFMNDLVANPRNAGSRYETLLTRKLVEILLRELIGVRLLSEQAQISAIQELSSTYLRKWPALMPGSVAPSPLVLTVALKEVAGLLQQLGNAPPPVQEALADPLVTLLAHPNHTTRVHAAWALKAFCHSAPLRLPKTIFSVMELLQRDINTLATPAAPSDIDTRALGHAYGLSALVSAIPSQPLYVSYDISVKVLDTATQLLKRAAEHDVKLAGVEIEVGWTLIAALMALGPNFVRAHLPQLLVLWRNALPKPTSRDGARGAGEWAFLLHVRERALGAVASFLRACAPALVTLDVARRVSSLLANALAFANAFVAQGVEEPEGAQEPGAMGLKVREALLRRRIYQCFDALGVSSATESTQAALLQSAVVLFASAEGYAGSSVQAAIASSSGSFTSIWQSADAYAYGLTGIDIEEGTLSNSPEGTATGHKEQFNRDTLENHIHELLRKPILTSYEHDPLRLFQVHAHSDSLALESPPPASAVVDAAIDLFARLLPLQDTAGATRAVTQLVEAVKSPKLEKNVGRRAAVVINASVAILRALRISTSLPSRQSREMLGNAQITAVLAPFLKDAIIDNDPTLRAIGSECIGRLASIAGTNFLTAQIKTLVDHVVSNRDPYGRAGCALAFGSIYDHVGGLAAGPLLKTTVNVLVSLSNDPHPVVHFWAIHALGQVVNAASLAYAPFVSSTLGMLLKTYIAETHEPEGGSLNNSNLSGDLPAYQAVCQTIDAVINVLGPDIQESSRTRSVILDLVQEFSVEDDEGIRVEAIKCVQHFLMFAPEHVRIVEVVEQFRGHLKSSRRPLKLASINALYQLVQKDALAMSKIGGDRLVEELFAMLDDDPSIDGVRNVISSWLQQTVIYNPSAWIDLCQRIMSRTTASQRATDSASKQGGMQDDEGESLSLGTTSDSAASTQNTSRWRTQLFALGCLHQICTTIAASGRREHLDIPFARRQGLPTTGLLVTRVPDLIKMAFTASAAYVTDIRLEGLRVLRDVIHVFSKSPDPDYEDALLLEQHQAPITAALTPAFSSDSTPEILASAVKACAVFVGCGIVKDVGRMGRILKLLTSALEQSKETGTLSLGDAHELSPNASVMLRIATVSAWAELAVARPYQSYLVDVLKPYTTTLASLWVASLRDYASIRADSEVLQDTTAVAVDAISLSLGRDVLLPYYTDTWAVILHAVSTAMKLNDPAILSVMDGAEPAKDGTVAPAPTEPREEPAAFFYIVFGLAYEALASSSAETTSGASTNMRETSIIALQALTCLIRPIYSGTGFLQTPVFQELISLCYRVAATAPPAVQVHLLEMLTSLAVSHPAAISSNGDGIPSGIPHTHCLRICGYILRHAIPGAQGAIVHADASVADRVKLVNIGFEAFTTIAATFGPSHREELRAVAATLYNDLLKDEISLIDLVSPTLQSLKTILEIKSGPPDERYGRIAHAVLSSCLTNVASMGGREGAIASRKVKTNLLAAVLVLTVVPPTAKLGRPAVEHCCFVISQKLVDSNDEISLTAVHCAKTLIAAAASGNPVLRHCVKHLLPGMVEYVARVASAPADKAAAGVGEVTRAFSTFFASVPAELRPSALGVLLPTLMLLLDAHVGEVVPQLLAFAAADPGAFKEAAGRLEQETRDALEGAIRQAVGARAGGAGQQQAAKPQISLRAF